MAVRMDSNDMDEEDRKDPERVVLESSGLRAAFLCAGGS